MIARKRAALWVGGGVLVVGAAAAGALALVTPRPGDPEGKRLATAARGLGRALTWMLEETPGRTRPQRCALAEPAGASQIPAGKRTYQRSGRSLRAEGHGRIVLGVVADARGAQESTLQAARTVKSAFEQAGVDVVVSLGGLGESKDEIGPVLRVLADKRWLLLALPGDRERVSEHGQAVAALASEGWPVVDGAALERVVVGDVTLAPLPGVAVDGWGLVAGPEGCGRGEEELARLPKAHVLLAHAPPRQGTRTGTDLARGDLHVGDPAVTTAATRTGARLVLHGLVDEAAGRVEETPERTIAATGALETGPVAGVVVELDGASAAGVARPRVRPVPRVARPR